MKRRIKISIMLPAYNEKGNIEPLTKRLLHVFSKLDVDYEFVYVIQGTDGAKESIERLKRDMKIKHMKILYYPKPIGVGPAHVAGFRNVSKDSDLVLTMDADLNHLPEEFPSFLKRFDETQADVIIGSRKVKGAGSERYSLGKRIISSMTNFFLINILRLKAHDITSGYRLTRYPMIKKVFPRIKAKNHEYYVEFLLWANRYGAKMEEVPIHFKIRKVGNSKLRWLPSAFGYLKLLAKSFRIRYAKG